MLEEEMLNKMKVLLISERLNDALDMKIYGFENITRFKTMMEAANYFKDNPKEFEQYHLIMLGRNSNELDDEKIINFEDMILKNELEKKCISGCITYFDGMAGKLDMSEITGISCFINNELIKIKVPPMYKRSYSPAKKFVEYINEDNIFVRRVLESNINNAKSNFFENSSACSASKRKQDLSILSVNHTYSPSYYSYRGFFGMEEIYVHRQMEEVANQLGVQFQFWESNDRFLCKRYIIQNLKKYDILLAPNLQILNSIMKILKESDEEYTDINRKLNLLVTADETPIGKLTEESENIPDFGYSIKLEYFFNGVSNEDFNINVKEYRLQNKDDFYVARSIIEASASIYNDKLIKERMSGIENFDFNQSTYYDQEYTDYENKEDERQRKILESIEKISTLRYIIKSISDSENELSPIYSDELKITQNPYSLFDDIFPIDGVKIENIIDGEVVSSMIIEYNPFSKYLNRIELQYLTESGTLSDSQAVAIYTSKYGKYTDYAKPNEKQMAVINEIEEKVERLFLPYLEQISNEASLQADSNPKENVKR